MFKNKIFLILIGIVVLGILGYSIIGTKDTESPKFAVKEQPKIPTPESYKVTMARLRYAKDLSLKESKESPIEDRKAFKGLHYYDTDTNYCILTVFEKLTNVPAIKVALSGGEKEEYQPVGKAHFMLEGQTLTLTVFKSPEEGAFFIPFNDTTNPAETYGGGRFLDVPATNLKGDKLLIDFNTAYNHFCAYNHTYTCPIPPKENKLAVAVRAGEKNF